MAGAWFENLEVAQVRNGLRAWDRPGESTASRSATTSRCVGPPASTRGVAVSCGHHPGHQACCYGNMSRSAASSADSAWPAVRKLTNVVGNLVRCPDYEHKEAECCLQVL